MAQKMIKVWYDPEGDFLEVIFDKRAGFFRETTNDQVMEKVKPLNIRKKCPKAILPNWLNYLR